MKKKTIKRTPPSGCLHQIGTIYYNMEFDVICMLTCVDVDLVNLICLDTGNRWRGSSVRVINPKHNGVHQKIFNTLCGDSEMHFIHNDFEGFMENNL